MVCWPSCTAQFSIQACQVWKCAPTLQVVASVDGMPEGALEALQVKNIALDRPIADKVSEVNKMLESEHSLIMLGEETIDEGLANMAEQSKTIQGQ